MCTVKKQRHTSPEIAPLAAQKLANPKTPKTVKELAGSVLSQAAPPRKGQPKKS